MLQENHLVLLKRDNKEIVELPSNVITFSYNDFHRDFDEYFLDFGSVAFRKSLAPQGSDPLRCVYDTRKGIPFWYLMGVQL